MIQALLNMPKGATFDDTRFKLGEVLGLGGAAPTEAVLRAIDDPGYATNLITCRNNPDFLAALFDDKRTLAYREKVPQTGHSSAALAGKAMSALLRWGKAGFSTVDQETLARREAACLSCPNLAEPQTLLQKMVPGADIEDKPGSRLGRRICTSCGCVTSKKIRLPTEACPERHPADATLTRWGEAAPAQAPRTAH